VKRIVAGAALFTCAALASCGGDASVVFGVTSEIKPSLIERIEARVLVGGEEQLTKTYQAGDLTFPFELRVDELSDGDAIDLSLDVFSGGQRILTRTGSTKAAEGRSVLYVANLDIECAGPAAPQCPTEQTCINGACADPFRDPGELSDYYKGWSGSGGGDRCEPGGSPEVIVGEGQAAYLPLDEGAVAQVEAGPQGGYHIWLAVRVKNLKQSGTVTEVLGRIPELGYDVPPFSVVFTFDPDEGGYCKIYGLRFRLDDEAHPIESLLGKDLEVTVQLTDTDGDVGTGTKTVRLSDSFL
jgi:hypothetical protein